MIFYLLAILLIKLGQSRIPQKVELNYRNVEGRLMIELLSHEEGKKNPFLFDIERNYTFTVRSFPLTVTVKDKQNIPVKIPFKVDDKDAVCQLKKNDFYFIGEEASFIGIGFCQFEEELGLKYNTLGLAFNISEVSNTYISRDGLCFFPLEILKRYNFVKKKGFGFGKPTNHEGKIYFDKMNSNEISDRFVSVCSVGLALKEWNCKLEYAFIDNDTKKRYSEKNTDAIFSSKINQILAPSDFMKYLRENIFKSHFKKGHCKDVDFGLTQISCFCNKIKDFPNITLVIGEKGYVLTKDDLFVEAEKHCLFSISANPKGKQWRIGNYFYEKFLPFFDYDSKTISFYSKEPVSLVLIDPNSEDFVPNNYFCKKIIFLGISAILTVSLFLLLLRKKM